VHDTDARRHDLERVERLHAPLQELVALAIPRELQLEILRQRFRAAREVHLHRVVDDQIHRHERLDDLRILPHPRHRRPHRREIDEQRHTREVLQHDARHHEGNLLRPLRLRAPRRQAANRLLGYTFAVGVAQQRLEHEPHRHRQLLHFKPRRLERRQRVKLMRRPVGREALQGVERIRKTHVGKIGRWHARRATLLAKFSLLLRQGFLHRREIRQVLRRRRLLRILDHAVLPDHERRAGRRLIHPDEIREEHVVSLCDRLVEIA